MFFLCWLLTFSCCFCIGGPVVSEAPWIIWRDLDFFCIVCTVGDHAWSAFFFLPETWRSVFKVNKLKLIMIFYTRTEAHFSTTILVIPSFKKNWKKTLHSTNDQCPWQISPSLLLKILETVCFLFQLLRSVVTSHDKGFGNFNEQERTTALKHPLLPGLREPSWS